MTKKCAVRLIRAVWFSPLDSLPEKPEENSGFHQSKIAGARQRLAHTIMSVLYLALDGGFRLDVVSTRSQGKTVKITGLSCIAEIRDQGSFNESDLLKSRRF